MTKIDSKKHWENVFQNKDTMKVSWYQKKPELSLSLIDKYTQLKSQSIIDIGGGDSRLPDGLLEKGYTDITVLDISNIALEKSKKRLAENSKLVRWENSDVLEFNSKEQFDLWHDRAVFHFINDAEDQLRYKVKILELLSENAIVIIGGFSKDNGPDKCSGINIEQHDRKSIAHIFCPEFEIITDFQQKHETPSGSQQNFYWVILKKNRTIDFWNYRYKQDEYAYGIKPNVFIKQELDKRKPGAVLFPAEGEGRNAVYAANLGWDRPKTDLAFITLEAFYKTPTLKPYNGHILLDNASDIIRIACFGENYIPHKTEEKKN